MLGAAAVVAKHRRAARVAVPTMLGSPRAYAWHNFSAFVAGLSPRYKMVLTISTGNVTAPISSWQATLQGLGSCYVQCVIPACEPYVDDIGAATAFTIYRTGVINGLPFSYQMAGAVLETAQLQQGPRQYTALISGHSGAFAVDDGLPTSLDRPLADVRTIASEPNGLRVRCAVDWLLRPGMRALLNGTPFEVGKIDYYVADGDQYMDVTEATS
jgi:hypothetical protein